MPHPCANEPFMSVRIVIIIVTSDGIGQGIPGKLTGLTKALRQSDHSTNYDKCHSHAEELFSFTEPWGLGVNDKA